MAKPSKAEKPPRLSRQERQELASRQKRKQNLLITGVAITLVAIAGWLIFLNIRNSMPVGGEQLFASLGHTHIDQGSTSPIAYNSTPPTSGPHYPGIAPWNSYNEPIAYEQVVHNLEDGGIVVYYQCAEACPDLIAQLQELIDSYLKAGKHLVLLPNQPGWQDVGGSPHGDMGARIALTAWRRLDTFDEFDADRIRNFIDRYEGIDQHNNP